MLESSRDVPLNVFVMLPSCVPATNLETAGAALGADALAGLMQEERVLGLAEVMNYPGVIFRDPEVMKKLALAGRRPVDGHAPGLTGRDLLPTSLQASIPITSAPRLMKPERSYAPACTSCCGRAALRKICSICCRWSRPKNARQFLFVSDDRHPADILREGHIDFMVRAAIKQGLDPIIALQIASLNAAQYFGLSDLGAIAPGYRADIAVLDGLEQPRAVLVIKDGKVVAKDGELSSR